MFFPSSFLATILDTHWGAPVSVFLELVWFHNTFRSKRWDVSWLSSRRSLTSFELWMSLLW